MSTVHVKRGRAKPLWFGHPWLYSQAIERVEGDSLWVRGLDAIDGTPVLDVKPHARVFDAPQGSREAEWLARLMRGYF